jgi:Zn-dependent alcohol dehydrogenase
LWKQIALYLIDQHRQGNYPPEKITTTYDVKDFAAALADTKGGKTIKAVLKW